MKLIFLDVDGVLNRGDTQGKFEDECIDALKYIISKTGAKFVLSSTWRYTMENQNTVLEKLKENAIIPQDEEFIGHTAHLGQLQSIPNYPTCDTHISRSDEILLWIKLNTVPKGCSREDFMDDSSESSYRPLPTEVANTEELLGKGQEWSMTGNWILDSPIVLDQFVVLDDLPMLKEGCYGICLKNHFVKTTMQLGLTMELARDAVRILNSKCNLKKWRKNTFKRCINPNCLLKSEEEKKEDEENISQSRQRRSTQCLIS